MNTNDTHQYSNRILGIELGLLSELLRTIVKEEMAEMRAEIKRDIVSKRESVIQEERLFTAQVAELFGVTRHTINNYVKNSTLPEPKRDISGRPYWTPDQLERAIRLRGIKTNYPV